MTEDEAADADTPADDADANSPDEEAPVADPADEPDVEDDVETEEADGETEDGAGDTDASDDEADADDGEVDETDDEDADDGGLSAGDFVEIAFTARTVEDEQLVDTTDPEVAEEAGVEGDQEFAPRTIVLGDGHVFGPVEEAILGSDVGDTGTATVTASEAFGEYDQDAVETVSADKIDEDDRYPGAHVHLDGRHGYVETIIGGRARVDFNHPLAGDDLEYEYEVLDVVEDRERQAAGLFGMYLDIEPTLWIETDEVEEEVLVEPDEDEAEADDDTDDEPEDEDDADTEETEDVDEPVYETKVVEKETLYVESTPQLTMNQQWMFSKQQIAQDIIEKVGVDRVIVQDVIEGGPAMGMGMPGMMGGGGLEEALADADVDADEIVEELEADVDE